MLTDFFRINMPYGIKKNSKNQWFAHNREYAPLGSNQSLMPEDASLPFYTEYKGLTENAILKIITEEDRIQRDEHGNIIHVFFYGDKTNPMNDSKYWNDYFDIIKAFSKFEIKNN